MKNTFRNLLQTVRHGLSGLMTDARRRLASGHRRVDKFVDVSLAIGGPLLVLAVGGMVLAALTSSSPKPAPQLAGVASPLRSATGAIPDKPTGKPSAPTPKEVWKGSLAVLLKAHEHRVRLVERSTGPLAQILLDATSPEGIGHFVEEVSGVRSKAKWAANRSEWIRWINERFRAHIFPGSPVSALLAAKSAELRRELQLIDNDALVAMGIDTQFDPAAAPISDLDLRTPDQAVDQAVASIAPAVTNAFLKHATGFGAGLAAGNKVHGAALNGMKDERGKNSAMDHLIALGIGWIAGELTERGVSGVSRADSALRDAVAAAVDDVRVKMTRPDGPLVRELVDYLSKLIRQRQQSLADAVLKQLGVNREWAVAAYNEAARVTNQATPR